MRGVWDDQDCGGTAGTSPGRGVLFQKGKQKASEEAAFSKRGMLMEASMGPAPLHSTPLVSFVTELEVVFSLEMESH